MTGGSERLGEERATVPTIVLPITRRGLLVTDRVCGVALGVAMALAAGLILWLNRNTTFNVDELGFLYSSPNLGLDDALQPYNGNLIVLTRLLYKAILETAGVGYAPFRLLGAASVIVSAGVFYALVKRRIGALPALAPTLVLLFLGSAWQYVVVPIGFSSLISIAAGLGALLALDRGDRRGDIGACALICLSVVTFSTGLAFLVGVGISVLLRPDRRRRAWIFLIPLALYAAWWLWALDSPTSSAKQSELSNVVEIPAYLLKSLTAATAALLGLDFQFRGPVRPVVGFGWNLLLAVPVVAALALRIRRGKVPPSLWVSLGIVLTYWTLGGFAVSPVRPPGLPRYVYMGAVGVFLVATDALRGIRFSRAGLAVLFAVCGISLIMNVGLLRDGGAFFRGYSASTRASFAALELARRHMNPGLHPPGGLTDTPATYFAVVDRYGSPAMSLPELESQSESVRQGADGELALALALHLEAPGARRSRTACRRIRGGAPGGANTFPLPVGGASLRIRGAAPGAVRVGRFADSPSAAVGTLPPGDAMILRIPRDRSPQPWRAAISMATSVELCRLGPLGS